MRAAAVDGRLVTTASQVRIGLDITMGQASFPASSDWRALSSSGGPIPAEYLIPGGVILGPDMFRVWHPGPPVPSWSAIGTTFTMRGLSTTTGPIYFTVANGAIIVEFAFSSPSLGVRQTVSYASGIQKVDTRARGLWINTPSSSSPVSIELTGLRIAGVPAP